MNLLNGQIKFWVGDIIKDIPLNYHVPVNRRMMEDRGPGHPVPPDEFNKRNIVYNTLSAGEI